MGVTMLSEIFSVRPTKGTSTRATIAAHCNAIEMASARRLIFLSRAFCSGSPSNKQLLSVPICSAAFFFSSDITHLSQILSASQAKHFCHAGRRRLPCFCRRGARRDVRCARPLPCLDTAQRCKFPYIYFSISWLAQKVAVAAFCG